MNSRYDFTCQCQISRKSEKVGFKGFMWVLRVLTKFLGFGILIFEFSVLELVYWQIYGKISVVLFEKL